MSDFKFIKNYLATIIAHHSEETGVLSVDDLITLTITYILTKTDSKNQDVFEPIVKNALGILGKKKVSELANQTFSSACDTIHTCWTLRLTSEVKSQIVNVLSSLIRLIAQIDETGYVSFSNSLYAAYLRMDKVGTESVSCYKWNTSSSVSASMADIASLEEQPQQNIESLLLPTNRVSRVRSNKSSVLQEDDDLIQFWNRISQGLDKNNPYFWQLHLQKDQYKTLREKISACVIAHPENRNYVIDNHPWPVACYVGEYYKRDWCGNDGSQNELSVLGLPQNYERIFEKCHISDSLVYAIQSEDRQNHRWQDSLRMLGGLPINYIVQKNNANTLLTSLVEVFQSDLSEEQSKIEVFIEKIDGCRCGIGGYALTQSILQGHSIFHYIQALLNDHFPFQNECEISPYKDFISSLYEVKKRTWNKFSLEWIYVRDEQSIAKELRISMLGLDEGALSKIQISQNRVYDWGFRILPDSLTMDVVFRCMNQDIARVEHVAYFVKTSINEITLYTKTGLHDTIILRTIPQEWFDEVVIVISGQSEEHRLQYVIKQYVQLYLTKDWTFSSNFRESSSIVVYNPDVYQPCTKDIDDNELIFSEGGKAHWCSIDNLEFSIEEKGKNRPRKIHFNSPYRILIEPILSRTDILYTEGKVMHCFINDGAYETELVSLVFGKRFRVYYQDKADVDEKKEITTDFKTSYFNGEAWNEGLPTKQGIYNLRITYRGREKQEKVYFIPYRDGKFVERDCIANVVRFTNLDLEFVYYPGEDCLVSDTFDANTLWQNKSLCVKNTRNAFYCNDEHSMLKYPRTTIPFMLGNAESFIVLPVYRCKNELYLYLSGNGIKAYNSHERLTGIPFILQKHFNTIEVKAEGVCCQSYRQHLWNINNVSNLWSSYQTKEQIAAGNKDYYICSKRHKLHDKNNVEYDIGAVGVNQYAFYLWDYKSVPVRLESTYESGKLLLQNVPFPQNVTDFYILFQSLAGGLTPRHYCAPISSKTIPPGRSCDCINVAVEHNVYFRMFNPLSKLVDYDSSDGKWINKVMTECLFPYLRTHQYRFESIQSWCYRFAEEFSFDWFLIGPKTWDACLRNAPDKIQLKGCIRTLLESNPIICEASEKRYLNNLTITNWSNVSPARTTGIVNDVLKIFTGKAFDFTRKSEEQRMQIIREFYQSPNICLKIYSQILN